MSNQGIVIVAGLPIDVGDDTELQAGVWSNSMPFPRIGRTGGSDYSVSYRLPILDYARTFFSLRTLDPLIGASLQVAIEDAVNASQITSLLDWQSRPRRPSPLEFIAPDNHSSSNTFTVDITELLRPIKQQAGWQSGNYCNLFFGPGADSASNPRGATSNWGRQCQLTYNDGDNSAPLNPAVTLLQPSAIPG